MVEIRNDYRELRRLRAKLIAKKCKTSEEMALLRELQTLPQIINVEQNIVRLPSLGLPHKVCKACGRPL